MVETCLSKMISGTRTANYCITIFFLVIRLARLSRALLHATRDHIQITHSFRFLGVRYWPRIMEEATICCLLHIFCLANACVAVRV